MEHVTTIEVTAVISNSGEVSANIALTAQTSGSLTMPTIIAPPVYSGSYEVTPSEDAQILATSDLIMEGDIKVQPIPNNYGLITYNGTTIMVS